MLYGYACFLGTICSPTRTIACCFPLRVQSHESVTVWEIVVLHQVSPCRSRTYVVHVWIVLVSWLGECPPIHQLSHQFVIHRHIRYVWWW